MDKWFNKLFFAILLIGFLVRFLDGIRVPLFIDELPILYNVAHFAKHRTVIPIHFYYPTFFSYLITFPVMAVFGIFYLMSGYPLSGLLDAPWVGFLFDEKLSLMAHGGRLVSALLSTATIYLVIRFARQRFGSAAALLAGVILAIDPFGGRYVTYSRFCLPDATAVFLVTLGMILCFQYLRQGGRRTLHIAALVFGLAISTKYNAGMAVIPLMLTPLMRREAGWWKTVFVSGLCLLAGFLVGSPGWLLVPKQFADGYLFEARHMAAGHLGAHDIDWLWIFIRLWQLKTYILPFAVLAVGYAFIRREKEDILIIALIVPSVLYIGQFEKKSIHYFLFLFPMTALLMGRWAIAVWNRLSIQTWRWTFAVLCGIVFIVYPSYRMGLMIRRDMMKDNRILAQTWVEINVPKDTRIALDVITLRALIDADAAAERIETIKNANSPMWEEVRRYYSEKSTFRLMNIRQIWEDASALDTLKADYILASYENYGRFFTNTPQQIPDQSSPLYEEYHNKKAFYFALFDESNPAFRFVKAFDSIAGPEVKIYKRILPSDNPG